MNKENLIDAEEQSNDEIIEGFNFIKEVGSPYSFKENNCPIKLGQNYFGYYKKRFIPSKISKQDYSYLIGFTIVPIFLSILFYLLLIVGILSKDILTIVFACIIYIFATFLQLFTFPRLTIFQSKQVFESYLNKLLNSSIKIYLKADEKKIELPVEFTTDITGESDIPDNINIIRMTDVQYFIDAQIKELIDKFKKAHKYLYDISFVHIYQGKKINTRRFNYWINSSKKSNNINFMSTILSILLLHWIKTFFLICSSKFQYVLISPAKLLSRNLAINSPTKLNIQGRLYKPEATHINSQITEKIRENLDTLDKDYNKEMKRLENIKKKEEKKKQEKLDREMNTDILSDFSTNWYTFQIIKVYDSVEAILDFPHYKRIRKPLGNYQPDIEEQYLRDEGDVTQVIPKGFNVKIYIRVYEDEIDIKFDDFHQRFWRYD